MAELVYTISRTKADLEGILRLQKSNLTKQLSSEELQSQGFVTLDHSYDQLKKMNDIEQHVIAKDQDNVVGYILAMTKASRSDIPELYPMFNEFDKTIYSEKYISQYNYLIIGQVCVDKNYRGRGIFDDCYNTYRNYYREKYDFAITEIATTNPRSVNAHKRIGFKEIHSYTGPDLTEWIIVAWDWK